MPRISNMPPIERMAWRPGKMNNSINASEKVRGCIIAHRGDGRVQAVEAASSSLDSARFGRVHASSYVDCRANAGGRLEMEHCPY